MINSVQVCTTIEQRMDDACMPSARCYVKCSALAYGTNLVHSSTMPKKLSHETCIARRSRHLELCVCH